MRDRKKIKGLAVIYEFPPKMTSESIVTFKYLKYSSINYTILTINSPGENSVYFNDFNKKIVRFNKENFEEKVLEYLDSNNNFDFFMTRVMPEDGHAIGFKIKEKLPNIKWIATYSDTIMNDPYMKVLRIKELKKGFLNYLKFTINNKYYFRKNFELNIQFKKLIKKVNLLILTNKYQKEYMIKSNKYDNKILIFPHSFDKKLYKKNEKYLSKDKINIVYTGSLDEVRNPKFFLDSIRKMSNENLLNNINIHFYGNVPIKYIEMVNDLNFIYFHNNIDYEMSLKIIKQADILLAIDSDLEFTIKKGLFLPAKLFDYLGSGNKIFALTIIPSPTSDLMKETGNYYSDYNYDNFKKSIIKAIKDNKQDRMIKNKYEVLIVSKKIDRAIINMLGGKNV